MIEYFCPWGWMQLQLKSLAEQSFPHCCVDDGVVHESSSLHLVTLEMNISNCSVAAILSRGLNKKKIEFVFQIILQYET